MSECKPTEYVVDFGDTRSNQFVRLNMTARLTISWFPTPEQAIAATIDAQPERLRGEG